MAKTVFVNGDPSQGIMGTVVDADFLNALQNHRHDGGSNDGSCPLNYADDTGTADAYVIALTPALTAHVPGMPLFFLADNTNTGASTLAVNSLSAVAMKRPDGSDLEAGDIRAGSVVMAVYDGTVYQVLSALLPSPEVVPAGVVAAFAASAAPTGWLKANGAAVSRTTYATLFSAIGTTFGVGDGSTTFNLPDLRGEFVRGYDDGRGVDADRVFGSAQAEMVGPHVHPQNYLKTSGGSHTEAACDDWNNDNGEDDWGINTGENDGTETRPRNIALLACIKY